VVRARVTLRTVFAVLLAGGVASAAGAPGAHGVVTAGGDLPRYSEAPDDDPGFSRAVVVAGLSGVYLGEGWLLTAQHVLRAARRRAEKRPDEPLLRIDGAPVELRLDDAVALRRAGESADLALVPVEGGPDWPLLRLAASTPAPGATLLLAGNGPRGEPGRACLGAEGAPLPAGRAGARCGVRWAEKQEGGPRVNALRWGRNRVASGARLLPGPRGTRTRVFATVFDADAGPDEAQAGVGDSGGPVFVETPEGWALAGVMLGVGSQAPRMALFGDRTFVADLSAYRAQILETVSAGGNP